MFAIRYNKDPEAKRWESGKPLGWIITMDGDWRFSSCEERDEIINEIKSEEMRDLERV